MKKLLTAALLSLSLLLALASCDLIAVEEISEDSSSSQSAEQDQPATEKADVITVVDGYLVVNGVKTEYEVKTADKIEILDGYLVVNGVKTDYQVELDCIHAWSKVTVAPTCSEMGYDILTCDVCHESVKTNQTGTEPHKPSDEYAGDDEGHWLPCKVCAGTGEKQPHTLDGEGVCTVCGLLVSHTPGVIYEVSADGTYAEAVEYVGTATKVRISSEYEGVPVTAIGANTFKNNATVTLVVIPDSVTSIGASAFYRCESLTSVVMGTGVTSIGASAFYDCVSLTSLELSDRVTSIGNYAFYGCVALTSVVIPDSVTSIGMSAFYFCENLTTVVIGDGLTRIGDYVFCDCAALTSVTIPDSVTSIGKDAFYGCASLTDIYYGGCEADWLEVEIDHSDDGNACLSSATVHYDDVEE